MVEPALRHGAQDHLHVESFVLGLAVKMRARPVLSSLESSLLQEYGSPIVNEVMGGQVGFVVIKGKGLESSFVQQEATDPKASAPHIEGR